MTQVDQQMAFQMHFQKLMHDVFSQTNSCIQEVNDYMYQLQMSVLMQNSQMQQQQCSYYPMPQMPMIPQQQSQMPIMPAHLQSQMPMILHHQQPWQPQMPSQPQQMPLIPQQQQQWQPATVTPVVVQPPTPAPTIQKPPPPKVTVTPPPQELPPIVKFRVKTKPKPSSGQLTPPSSNSSRNSLIDELRNSGGRKSLRKTSKQMPPKKDEQPQPPWARSRDREKRSSFTPPGSFETLEAFLLATKDHQKSMPNLRTLSRANSDDRKSPLALMVEEEKVVPSTEKPKPTKESNVAIAIKAALENPETPSHTSSTEIIPRDEACEEAREEINYNDSSIVLSSCRELVPHKQLNSEYPDAPHGWQLLMWTIRKVGKFLKKHEKDDWELVHHK